MKKITRRGASKYPALDPALNLKTRWEEISDLDYIEKLSDKEKEWLNRFMGEYVNADFRNDKNLHKTSKAKRTCYNRNNARNRDILTQAKACGSAVNIDSCNENEIFSMNDEERLNNKIDIDNYLDSRKKLKRSTKKSKKGSSKT